MKHFRILFAALLATATLLATSCENEKSAGDAVIDVTPSYAILRQGASVTLTASGPREFVWELENEEIGSLSSRHGRSVVSTARVCEGDDTTQTVHVYSGVSSAADGTTRASWAGAATIRHRGTGK